MDRVEKLASEIYTREMSRDAFLNAKDTAEYSIKFAKEFYEVWDAQATEVEYVGPTEYLKGKTGKLLGKWDARHSVVEWDVIHTSKVLDKNIKVRSNQ